MKNILNKIIWNETLLKKFNSDMHFEKGFRKVIWILQLKTIFPIFLRPRKIYLLPLILLAKLYRFPGLKYLIAVRTLSDIYDAAVLNTSLFLALMNFIFAKKALCVSSYELFFVQNLHYFFQWFF